MRSLLCMEHSNWEGTLAAIEQKGGKAGQGACRFSSTDCALMMFRLGQEQAQRSVRLRRDLLGT
jgi:hypothetical protein